MSDTRASEDEPFFAVEQAAVRAAVTRIAPMLVRIQTLGGRESSQGILASDSPTTGVVIAKDGYILSSAFHFIQEPSSILVTLPDGSQHPAKLVARDHARQLVLLNIDIDQELPTPVIVSRDEMQVGQRAIAVGGTFGGEFPSLSVGIVSATNRIWGRALQTDAKISPNNYGGPLIDLEGGMLGLLVPLSPQSNSDVAGVEWYDSGIGFAAYLDDYESHLETLKSGTDLRPGRMGITLKGKNIFTAPAIAAAVQVGSPAADAGIQVGDEIVAVDGSKVSLQAHLKHALGVRYAGEEVRLTVRREAQTIDVQLQLAEKIEPYATPFLGVLPVRHSPAESEDDAPRRGLDVRYVYQDSPAAKAGIESDCRLLGIQDAPLDSITDWHTALAKYQAGDTLDVTWQDRPGNQRHSEVVLANTPTGIPSSLPPANRVTEGATGAAETAQRDAPLAEWLDVKIPEFPNACPALVPTHSRSPVETDATDADRLDRVSPARGVLMLLGAPGSFDKDSVQATWQQACHARQLILLAPQPRDATRWQREESEFLRKALDSLGRQLDLDPHRIAIVGRQAGGAMALHFTLANRDVVRGLALVDAKLPPRIRPPENNPFERLDILLFTSATGVKARALKNLTELLQQQKLPVVLRQVQDSSKLPGPQRAELIRWIDTLDRI